MGRVPILLSGGRDGTPWEKVIVEALQMPTGLSPFFMRFRLTWMRFARFSSFSLGQTRK
jgi:hypothetical protein